jgi:hypothetical protein
MHYDTVRKHWRAWAGLSKGAPFLGFPLPFRYPEPGRRGHIVWRLSAVNDWKAARERALGAAQPPVPQPQAFMADAHATKNPRLARERSELSQLLERN